MKRLIPLLLLACSAANAQGYLADVVHSSTSVLLPCIPLRALDDTPAGGTLETGITASTAGLEIKVRSDNSAGWEAEYSQASGTINNKASAIGTWETPATNDAEIGEVDTGAGCYQLDLADTTWSKASAKYVQILIRDSSSPTFADTMVTVNLNATSAATLVDNILDEPCAGHTTSDTMGDQLCDQATTDTTNIRNDISNLSDGSNPVWTVGGTIATGACDSGSTTTCVDATLTSSETDYLANGAAILFTSDGADKQARCITGFTPASDTITFEPATTTAVVTNDYVLFTAPTCAGPLNDSITQQAIATGAIGASEIASDAIGSDELAGGAITSSEISAGAITAGAIASDAITSAKIASSAIGSSELATDAIGSAQLAASALDEIWNEVAEDQGSTYTAREVLSLLLSEAMGTCTYTQGTRTWVCSDPSGTETRFTLVYGTELDGDRSSSTPAPVTP